MEAVGKLVLRLVIAVIALRMLIGLIVLALKLVGLTADWLQKGAPFDLPSLRLQDFIISGIVLVILTLLNWLQKGTESDSAL
ncbi:MAG: hypothetical protein K8I82_09860 [Anaerolineae bacterium]|nr:hypothetical protein [Anaerolineae bacterium]